MQEIKSNCYPLTKNCRLVTLAWCTKSMFRIGIFGNLAIRINVANIANMDIPEKIFKNADDWRHLDIHMSYQ